MSEICPVILIVDDTPENLFVLAEMLKSAGWHTRDAGNGSTALEQMASALPDLILLDVMMPGIDGFETCKRIKQDDRFSSIPVIFMTALDEVFHKVQGFDAGAVDYITKPFYHDEVIARVRTHLKIVQMQKQIEQQNALKDRFMQIAAHDLRNPLTSIQLAVDLLLHMLANPGRPNQMLSVVQSIASTTRRMNHLIGSFLDHRKAAANRLDMDIGALDLPSLVCSVADNHRSFADKKNIRIELRIPDLVPLCSGDENRSHQIITNLVSNAIKYTPQGGVVSLRILPGGEHIKFEVADSGPGVLPSERSMLFTEYANLSNTPTDGESSTGLGLWIVRKLAQAQGGQADVYFPEAGGSVFWATWRIAPTPD